ncbi:DUF4019 domain-containing protein [Caballeronia sp. RCC_10]|uniref:DUF4019 domain-containing protein n=1 Tax=Caballeronia sp. RCC_10 TaxID=3239227 RepID=UPI0035242F2C
MKDIWIPKLSISDCLVKVGPTFGDAGNTSYRHHENEYKTAVERDFTDGSTHGASHYCPCAEDATSTAAKSGAVAYARTAGEPRQAGSAYRGSGYCDRENDRSEQGGGVWDGSSAVAKKIISREDFANKVTRDRAALGTPGMRMPLWVRHLQFDGTGNMPAGSFMSWPSITQFDQARQSSRESVTSMLHPDRRWRFVGYSVR